MRCCVDVDSSQWPAERGSLRMRMPRLFLCGVIGRRGAHWGSAVLRVCPCLCVGGIDALRQERWASGPGSRLRYTRCRSVCG